MASIHQQEINNHRRINSRLFLLVRRPRRTLAREKMTARMPFKTDRDHDPLFTL